MRIILPKDGQTYLYFYENRELEPSADINKIKKLLRDAGCKIGPAWKREQPEYYLCSCVYGDFKLVADVPGSYIESMNPNLMKSLAIDLVRACHKYKIGTEIRLKSDDVVTIVDYQNEDYLVERNSTTEVLEEEAISCIKKIPDDILGKRATCKIFDSFLGECETIIGVVKEIKQPSQTKDGILCLVIAAEDDGFEDELDYKRTVIICENEVLSLSIFDQKGI